MTYEAINRAVGDFNVTISAKYRLMATPQSKLTEEKTKRYHVYKGHENAETKGSY